MAADLIVEVMRMAFNELIAMNKSINNPHEGDVFVLQPKKNVFYFGKVIQTDLKSEDSLISGTILIYIYDCFCNDKLTIHDLNGEELLVAPMIVNNQPWEKGYFETIDNVPVSERERSLEFGFWDLLTEEYLDIQGMKIGKKPKYCSIYGLGSYGVVGKEVQKAIKLKQLK